MPNLNTLLDHGAADIVAQVMINAGLCSDPETKDSDGFTTGDWVAYVDVTPDTPDNVVVFKDSQGIDGPRESTAGIQSRFEGVQLTIRARTSDLATWKARRLQWAMEVTDPSLNANAMVGVNVTLSNDQGDATYRFNGFSDVGNVLPVGYEEGTDRFICTINVTATMRKLS